MKTLLGFFAAFGLAGNLFAAQFSIGGSMRGLNDGDASILIEDQEAQDLLNVDVTENGYGIKKRSGYAEFKSLTVSTAPVNGAHFFRDTSGYDNIVHAHNKFVSRSRNSGAYTNFLTTATLDSYWDFADSLGYLYGGNSSHDEIWRYDGTTLTYYPSTPKGSILEFTPDRFVVSGTTANPNRINFSKLADPTDFTTGNNEEDPFYETFGMPGQSIQALKYVFGRLLIWTKNTLAYWAGTNQFDGAFEDVSNTIGTVQSHSIVHDLGLVYWQGQDGHFYSYDGNSIAWISKKISGSVDDFTIPGMNGWTITSQADWGAGTFGGYLSSTSAPGSLFDSYEGNQYSNSLLKTSVGAKGQSFRPQNDFILSYARLYLAESRPEEATNPQTSTWTIRTNGTTAWSSTFLSTATFYVLEANQGYFNVTFSPAVSLSANTTYWIVVSTMASQSCGALCTYAWAWSYQNSDVYSRGLSASALAGSQTLTPQYDMYFLVADSSSVYQSESHATGSNVSSWGIFEANQTLSGTGDSIAYAIYGDTDTSITLSNTGTYTSSQTITSGSVPTIATAAYVTVGVTFTRSVSTETPAVNAVDVRWNEGGSVVTWGVVDKNHRIVWAVAEDGSASNNTSYIYDPRFDTWLKYDVPFNAPVNVDGTVYFSTASIGTVNQFPSGNTDAGSAITSYWKSKDFLSAAPYQEKMYDSVSILAKSQTGSNLDITHTVNTSSSVSNNFTLTDADGNSVHRINYYLPSGTFGTFLSLQVGNQEGDAPWEVYGLSYSYEPKPWRVIP
jgi:hypothetical protein